MIFQMHLCQQFHCAPIKIGEAPLRAPEIKGSSQTALQCHPDIFKNREMREDCADLKGAHDSAARDLSGLFASDVLAAIENAAGAGLQELGEQIEEGGLARTVRSDQGVDFALPDAHRDAVDRDEAVEVLDQTVRLEDYLPCQRHRALPPLLT